MEGDNSCRFGTVCVTGGTGFVASWLISKLLEHGYTVNATIRSSPDREKDVSYLTNLPGASERLRIFSADLYKPDSFDSAIEGCVGVFHVAHPIEALGKETEEQSTRKAIDGTLGILKACLKAKTVKRIVCTSATSTLMFGSEGLDIVDESIWSDIDRLRGLNNLFGIYSITKTLTEKAALEFAEQNGLDVVTVIPPWITGPFLCPKLPVSVRSTMAMLLGEKEEYMNLLTAPMVHTDDLVRAHIFLFQHPEAKGRYICSAVDVTRGELAEFLSARYPQYQISSPDSLKNIEGMKFRAFSSKKLLDSLKDIGGIKLPALSSKKLLDTGFKYRFGIEEIYDDAIKSCKEKGFL